jgi:fumarylacetoacetase
MMENEQAELLKSWVQVPKHSDFTIYNLPFGIFRNKRLSPRVGIAIGDKIVDLSVLQEEGFFQDIKLEEGVFLVDSLNPLIALGKSTTKKVRDKVQQLLGEDNPDLKDHQSRGKIMVGLKEAEMMLPLRIGDCTAFEEVSLDAHAAPSQRLFPEFTQRKVSTLMLSGASFHRPQNHIRTLDKVSHEFGPTRALDFEVELAFVVGRSTRLGDRIGVADAEDYLFGALLFNDWTARDVQSSGGTDLPHASKSFASGISPWVVTLDALEYFRSSSPVQHPDLMPYLLDDREKNGFEIQLEVYLKPEKDTEQLVSRNNFKHADWTAAQLLTQQTVNGSNVEIGDIIAAGAVNRSDEGDHSSLGECTEADSLTLEDSGKREFVRDGDTVILRAYGEKEGIRVGFGELIGKVLPPK